MTLVCLKVYMPMFLVEGLYDRVLFEGLYDLVLFEGSVRVFG